jgi:6-phosphofructokinase 2
MRIATLTMNPAIDVSTSVERIAPFHKLRCALAHRDPGGGGINVARVLKRFGADVLAVYVAGGSTGDLLEKLMHREGIGDLVLRMPDETREDFTVNETSSGKQFRFVMPGPELGEACQNAVIAALAALDPKPGMLVASGSLPPGVPPAFLRRVGATARQIGARLVVDTSGDALRAAVSERPFLVKPNLGELRALTGIALDDEAARLAAARKLVADGGAEMVALTLGEEGALLVSKDLALRAKAPPVEVASTVGAGDSFLGALVWGLASDEAPERAFARAVAAGSAALLAPGTGLCRPGDVERLLPQVKVERL